jgi:phenylacetate-CoA ligase
MKISLYRSLPGPLQKAARAAYGALPFQIRMGRTYRETKGFLQSSQNWTKESIEAWQWKKLKTVIEHAYENVSGYRQLYSEQGVAPRDIRNWNDFKRLPFVTKEQLRDNLEDFTASNIPRSKRLYRTTGGSTGIPFGFYLTQDNIERELAFLNSAWERVGWIPGSLSAVLRGAFIGSEKKLFDYDPFLRELKLSTYQLTEKTYSSYKERILRDRPSSLQAYPSAATILADMVIANDDVGKVSFDFLLLGSENLYDWQKERLRSAFPRARLFAWYGHAEQVLFAPMCESSEQFHLDPFYGVSEILNPERNETNHGESGELVGTALWNYAVPFIRYRTMDVATKGAFGCSGCRRNFQLLERIDGRLQEFILSSRGRYISMTQINMHSPVFDNVMQFQFHQRTAGEVTFNIVRGPHYSEKDSESIRRELSRKLGEDIKLDVVFVDQIPRTQNGKFRFLIQELPLRYGDRN